MAEHETDQFTREDVDERTELARQRTTGAATRTVLANERTFTAWLRTGLSAIALGLAAPRLLTTAENAEVALTLGLMLIVLGVITGVLAAYRYTKVAADLQEAGHELMPGWVASGIVAGLTLIGVFAVVLALME